MTKPLHAEGRGLRRRGRLAGFVRVALRLSLMQAFLLLSSCGSGVPWAPGLEREVACEGDEAVPWTPWLHYYVRCTGLKDHAGCYEDPYVEFYDSKEQLAARLEEWDWPSYMVTDMFVDFHTDQAMLIASFCDSGGRMLEVSCLSQDDSGRLLAHVTDWRGETSMAAETCMFTVVSFERAYGQDIDVIMTRVYEDPEYMWAPL